MKAICAMTFAAGLALGEQDVIWTERAPVPPPGARQNVMFFRSGGEAAVKGAPYTADSVTEHVQTLADGNRITQSNKSKFARDGEGRIRRESTILGLGRVGQTEAPVVSVFIDDPVAKVQYTLDAERKVAMKHKAEGAFQVRLDTPAVGGSVRREDVVVERKVMAAGTVPAQRIEMRMHARMDGNAKTEDLGVRNIEGVSAKGTRTVMTIPAGEVGNDRPMEVVTETWVSDEIKAVVLTKHTDPRSGEMTTRLTNVQLGEPSKSLFEPPADYKVEEIENLRMPDTTKVFRVKEDR